MLEHGAKAELQALVASQWSPGAGSKVPAVLLTDLFEECHFYWCPGGTMHIMQCLSQEARQFAYDIMNQEGVSQELSQKIKSASILMRSGGYKELIVKPSRSEALL